MNDLTREPQPPLQPLRWDIYCPALPNSIRLGEVEADHEFFSKMKKRRIACLTYHKYPGEDWPRDEFIATEVHMAS
jgi:hypothetical protein